MCGSVTAAIPRKQTCRCGGESSTTTAPATPVVSQTSIAEVPSPTKSTFKVQKVARPPSRSRKQSYDPVNFDRMDMNSVNILSYKQQGQNIPINMSAPSGYSMVGQPQIYGYPPQYASIQTHFNHVPMQTPPVSYDDGSSPIMGVNGFSNGTIHGKEPYAVESPLGTPTMYNNGNTTMVMKTGSCCAPPPPLNTINGNHINKIQTNGKSKASSDGGSCCAPKQKSLSHTSSIATTISESEEPKTSSCCSSKPVQPMKQESISTNGTPRNTNPPSPNQVMAQGSIPFTQPFYPQYLANVPTVFTYPPTYGSFQNPLQPSAWRESMRTNNYSPHPSMPMPGSTTYNGSQVAEVADTVHTCCCGDSCECIGCAAHPYNDASQSYVRSAYQSMTADLSGGEMYTNGQPHTNGVGNGNGNGTMAEPIASPTANTPSSTTSGNAEEQSLSASDFFFVNYPFSGEGCGGDTMSCPCGDDCQCIGCTIHRQPIPGMPCGGEEESCPCGDNCECIGCSIHQGMQAST